MFLRKEKIISKALTVENICKNYFDLNLIKILILNKSNLSKFDYLYEKILQDDYKINTLREFVYFSNSKLWEQISGLKKTELINYLIDD